MKNIAQSAMPAPAGLRESWKAPRRRRKPQSSADFWRRIKSSTRKSAQSSWTISSACRGLDQRKAKAAATASTAAMIARAWLRRLLSNAPRPAA